jgi:WD40 repeat protein
MHSPRLLRTCAGSSVYRCRRVVCDHYAGEFPRELFRLWNAATGAPICKPLRHEDSVAGAAFSPDGTILLTASEDKTARLWDAATGTPIGKPMRHNNNVTSAAFSPDGARVVTTSSDKTARRWKVPIGRHPQPERPPAANVVNRRP